ncbi:TPA: hypothetical protein UMU63_002761 [Stenotrophomonas maltophilia]|nr:hypothetical protein [Stenotrophomonas maltophilia]HEL3737813.1 hypothetical protein [Stenotrophomonas maltophilia]
MGSLVLELQRDALDRTVSAADLLRKALVVARKLKVTDLVDWLTYELNGYPEGADVPEYRKLRGELKVHNPYNGWVPLIMSNPEHAEILSKRGTSQAISELDKIANGGSSTAYVRLPRSIENNLMSGMEFPLQPAVILSHTQIHGLVDKVRSIVLEWALGLEEQGIMGEGMSFSAEDQKQAGNVTLNVGNLGNLIGSMQDSQIQQDTTSSTQGYSKGLDLEAVARVIRELRSRMDEVNLEGDAGAQIKSEVACVETQLAAPSPNVSVIRESLRSTRAILEGVASSAVFQGIITALGAFR